MSIHSSIHAWRTPWSEEPGGLQTMGSQRAGHDRVIDSAHAVRGWGWASQVAHWFRICLPMQEMQV